MRSSLDLARYLLGTCRVRGIGSRPHQQPTAMSAIEPQALTSSLLRASPTEPDAEPLDLIFIEGFEHPTIIGIHAGELATPQTVRIDLAAGMPRCAACHSDNILDTIDYSAVRQVLQQLLLNHRWQLLEALAEEIARLLLQDFGAHWVRVALAKPRKFPDVEAVGVVIERRPNAAMQRPMPVLTLIGAGMVPSPTKTRSDEN
jgi:dihydroneopterin aldolase